MCPEEINKMLLKLIFTIVQQLSCFQKAVCCYDSSSCGVVSSTFGALFSGMCLFVFVSKMCFPDGSPLILFRAASLWRRLLLWALLSRCRLTENSGAANTQNYCLNLAEECADLQHPGHFTSMKQESGASSWVCSSLLSRDEGGP